MYTLFTHPVFQILEVTDAMFSRSPQPLLSSANYFQGMKQSRMTDLPLIFPTKTETNLSSLDSIVWLSIISTIVMR